MMAETLATYQTAAGEPRVPTSIEGELEVRREGQSIILAWPHGITVPPGARLELWLNRDQAAALWAALALRLLAGQVWPEQAAGHVDDTA